MTPQEAMEIRKNPHFEDVDNEELSRCIDEALEKQIAKKPTAKHSDNIFTGMDGTCLVCPSCEKRIINVWNRAEYKPNYCHYCGQAIDWSAN